MKITFLGTGTSQGIPVIGCKCEVCSSVDYRDNRLRSSILVEIDGTHIVVDTGPDFRQQMLRERVDKLDAVLFTHAHKDHVAGLDDIRSFNFLQKKDMPIYATSHVLGRLKQEFSYIFEDSKYPGVPRVDTNPIENETFQINGIDIQPIEVMHYKLPVLGFRFGDFTYITDANHIAEEEKEKIKGSKILVLNALQKKSHISHFNLEEALELIEELKPEKGYLTHIGHFMGTHFAVSKELPENVEIAWDGLKLVI
ncbi:phosphoribosyl 1,2-cyclic phosphate phosphodiesterase [Ekhidna lutea]|uniref:Phosphoribosyl 1,2-cyclic phosphate phosphodiesterase n=1 Tax=Ekhidna lutea TaxID=447679 RepID=A0A239K1F2_EKHLU|nr:MBL fold metallo-hydrolase [Ekhidna lutea]SNT11513.1 phosphoribosyl 1,2-cyclic phosphate phosphodiesterase [Ekhidna lutea]